MGTILRENAHFLKMTSKKSGAVIVTCLACDPQKKREYKSRLDAARLLTRDHLSGPRHKKNLEKALAQGRLLEKAGLEKAKAPAKQKPKAQQKPQR